MDVVVVESPTKAKTINKYLGDRYRVLPSYGHVRDLPELEALEDAGLLEREIPGNSEQEREIIAADDVPS